MFSNIQGHVANCGDSPTGREHIWVV